MKFSSPARKFVGALLVLFLLVLTGPAATAQRISEVEDRAIDVRVFPYAQRQDIPAEVFGLDNAWGDINPEKANFRRFYSELEDLGMTHFRFPGGWQSEWYDWPSTSLISSIDVLHPDGPRRSHIQPKWYQPCGDPDGACPLKQGPQPWQLTTNLKPDNAQTESGMFVLPVQKYICNPTGGETALPGHVRERNQLATSATEAVRVFKAHSDLVKHWEIGNEWFYMRNCPGSSDDLARNYARIAAEITRKITTQEEFDDDIKLYVTGRWFQSDSEARLVSDLDDFETIRTHFEEAGLWDKIDGVSVHVYTGFKPVEQRSQTPPPINQVATQLGKVSDATGKPVFVTEWAATKAHNTQPGAGDVPPVPAKGLAAANYQMQLMSELQKADVVGATYWPTFGGSSGIALLTATKDGGLRETPLGQTFALMAEYLSGAWVPVRQGGVAEGVADTAPSAAAAWDTEQEQLNVIVAGKNNPDFAMDIRIVNPPRDDTRWTVVAAEVLYAKQSHASKPALTDDLDCGDMTVRHSIRTSDDSHRTDIEFTMNPSGARGKQAGYEIVRLTLVPSLAAGVEACSIPNPGE